MRPEYPFVPPRRHPNCLMLIVRLRGAPCRRRRRAFFARMHAEARRLGIVMSQRLGLCLLFGAERICTTAHRHQMTTWLMDQPEVRSIQVGELFHLGDLFERDGRRRQQDTAAVASNESDLASRLIGGLLMQWLLYLWGRV